MIENLVDHIKEGQYSKKYGKTGFKLAKAIACEHASITGNDHIVRRVLIYRDKFNNHDREHYGYDVVELIRE